MVLSGLETELTKTVDMKLLHSESKIIGIIPRYRSLTEGGVNAVVEYFVMFIDEDNEEMNYITVPKFKLNHQHFGFDLHPTTDFMNINVGDILPPKTKLAVPQTIKENDGYAFGTHLNISFMSMKETAEDPVIISESAAEKLEFKLWEKRTVTFSGNNIPLNLYGDEENYKIFPDIGERVHDSNVLVATRRLDDEMMLYLTPSLMSDESLRDIDTLFDNAVYVRGSEGVVVDVKVFRNNTTNKRVFYDKAVAQADRYADALKAYREDIKVTYEQARRQYPNIRIAPHLHAFMVSVFAHLSEKVRKVHKKDRLEDYQIEITVEYKVKPGLGFKIATMHGSKGIISLVKPDKEMPVDKAGNRADMIIDLRSITARMNDGNVYEQYITAAVQMLKHQMLLTIQKWYPGSSVGTIVDTLTNDQYKKLFKMVKDFTALFGNKQSEVYAKLKDIKSIREIVAESILDAPKVILAVDNPVGNIELVQRIMKSPFAPINDRVEMTPNGDLSYRPIFIGPVYILLLDKIADTWLACSSSRLNHFGIPVGTSKVNKHGYPWAYNPTKILSETEGRVIAAYAGPDALAEMKDRALNHDTHERIYRNLVTAPNPMAIEDVAERHIHGFKDDHVISLLHSIYKTFGTDFGYVEETRS
jgi:hypothetical protein